MRLNKAGFSLMELLLAASLVPIISLAIFGNLNSGLKIWNSVNKDAVIEDLGVFYEKSERDFLNMTKFGGIPFKAEDGKVSFMTLIVTDALLGKDKGLGEVTYSHDVHQKMILREERNMHDLYREEGGLKSAVLQNVASFKASFLVYEKPTESYRWQESWEEEEGKTFPVAVRFQFELSDGKGTTDFVKTYKIPIGGE